jgi:prepilin-type processing-associated H-X9-DG protein
LIEVLVVVGIIALLVAILLPSLRKVRDLARETKCAATLQQFGRGFYSYAAGNKDYLCSGAFDPGTNPDPDSKPENNDGRDGAVDRIGWVADLVNSRSAHPAEMLCPTNPARYNQKLAQTGGSSGPYTAEQATKLIARGYNTNYTQSWYMARSEVTSMSEMNWKRVFGKRGPLTTSFMVKASASRVPLLGDGSIESSDLYLGQRTARTMTDGPFEGPYSIQNYEDFGPAHGRAPIGDTKGLAQSQHNRANILFGDGHVSKFIDRVRNGRFGIVLSETSPLGEQEDLAAADVFDGVLSLGRRSESNWTVK